mmetsp:Transcript_23808/g.51455  ORF Transcript_23808/g.51455 Transcript_23808/m.51455 type:complete len:80 (-) Transcript_23808:47-286(-)
MFGSSLDDIGMWYGLNDDVYPMILQCVAKVIIQRCISPLLRGEGWGHCIALCNIYIYIQMNEGNTAIYCRNAHYDLAVL